MKRAAVLGSGVLALFLCLSSAASASPPAPPPPAQDSVVLTGAPAFTHFTSLPTYEIDEINVTSGPSGENPSGEVAFLGILRGPPFPFNGPVTCLAVRGNVATINFEDQTTLPGSIVTVEVVDNQPDSFGAQVLNRSPTDCSPANYIGNVQQALLNGDITVVDAPAAPASKDECKNGGWQRFGFANQGQCIAFVNHGRTAGSAS
jgi:hypothetical protein